MLYIYTLLNVTELIFLLTKVFPFFNTQTTKKETKLLRQAMNIPTLECIQPLNCREHKLIG